MSRKNVVEIRRQKFDVLLRIAEMEIADKKEFSVISGMGARKWENIKDGNLDKIWVIKVKARVLADGTWYTSQKYIADLILRNISEGEENGSKS